MSTCRILPPHPQLHTVPLGEEPRHSKRIAQATTGKGLFQDLPTEILLHIARYTLLPTAKSYHVFEFTDSWRDAQISTVVHAFGRPLVAAQHHCERRHNTALSRVSRRLEDVYNTVIYSESNWVFEVSQPFAGENRRSITGGCERGGQPESWCRSFERQMGALWPLTASTLRYVKDVTILMAFPPSEERCTSSFHRLQTGALELQDLVGALAGRHRLRMLAVDICNPKTGNTWFDDRLGYVVDGRDSYALRLSKLTSPKGEGEIERARDMWRVLAVLRDIHNVQLSGLIGADDARLFAGLMSSPSGGDAES